MYLLTEKFRIVGTFLHPSIKYDMTVCLWPRIVTCRYSDSGWEFKYLNADVGPNESYNISLIIRVLFTDKHVIYKSEEILLTISIPIPWIMISCSFVYVIIDVSLLP